METMPRSAAQTLAVTLPLSAELYAMTQEAVALGLAPSQEAFIEDAIRGRIREVRHARMRKLAAEAMADPSFVADMRETMDAFRPVDGEHWPPPLEDDPPCENSPQ